MHLLSGLAAKRMNCLRDRGMTSRASPKMTRMKFGGSSPPVIRRKTVVRGRYLPKLLIRRIDEYAIHCGRSPQQQEPGRSDRLGQTFFRSGFGVWSTTRYGRIRKPILRHYGYRWDQPSLRFHQVDRNALRDGAGLISPVQANLRRFMEGLPAREIDAVVPLDSQDLDHIRRNPRALECHRPRRQR